jgi:hypothetical protein
MRCRWRLARVEEPGERTPSLCGGVRQALAAPDVRPLGILQQQRQARVHVVHLALGNAARGGADPLAAAITGSVLSGTPGSAASGSRSLTLAVDHVVPEVQAINTAKPLVEGR